MGGMLGATVRFNGPAPNSAELVAALCQHTGESISYTEEWGSFECATLQKADTVFADADENEWELLTGYLEGSYFWFALLVVFEKLGGVQIDFDGKPVPSMPAPSWAYQPWWLARQTYRQR